jgi:hypothetical protein
MTGGLVYALRRSVARGNYNREFVRCAAFGEAGSPSFAASAEDPTGISSAWGEIDDDQEELWLRRVLREHVRLTGSPRARRLLNSEARLPLVRLEPVHLPCSIAQTWEPILNRLEQQEIIGTGPSGRASARHSPPPGAPLHDAFDVSVESPVEEAPALDSSNSLRASASSALRGPGARSIAKPAC